MPTKTIRKLEHLVQEGLISQDELIALQPVSKHYDFSISHEILELLKQEGPEGIIAKQYLPSSEELNESAEENPDPIGDSVHSPVKGVVHRYPDRCLVMPVAVCKAYCRYCFRRSKVGKSGQNPLTHQEWEAIFHYLGSKPDIWEVILTGGDPLILKPYSIKKIIDELKKIEHIQVLRIHSKIPIVSPTSITDEYIQVLKSFKPCYLVIHVNHAKELTQNVLKTLERLSDNGIQLLSQTVLLKGINNNVETLTTLMKSLIKVGVKPYYLHHPDLAPGTSHFRLSLEEGIKIVKGLWGNISGICQPRYVLDIPGGHGKIPISTNHSLLSSTCPQSYLLEDYQGGQHQYDDYR